MSAAPEDPFNDPGEDCDESSEDAKRDTESLPELPAPPPREPGGRPAQSPIDLADLDPANARRLVTDPIGSAAAMSPAIDRLDVEKMVGATIDLVVERAREGGDDGICLKELAERAKIGRGRIGERFGAELTPFANLAVRAIHAQADRPVFYEQLSSHSAKVGRRHNGVGTDKLPKQPNSLHLLNHSLGCSDRHCPVGSEPLATGTRWDRSSARFGVTLPGWAKECLGFVPNSFAEHLGRVLEEDQRARQAFGEALRDGRRAFTAELTPRRFGATFSPFVVVPAIRFGPPPVEYRDHADVHLPGRDEATVDRAASSGRRLLLACGTPGLDEREEFEAESARLTVGKLPSMYELGIRSEYAVEYRWSARRHELGRYVVGRGARLDLWRLVGVGEEEGEIFWQMLALVERLSQVAWTDACTKRWEDDCRPGLQKAHLPESCAGVRALLAIANAAIVDAVRREGAAAEFA
jgi:hypothetical protein